MTKFSIITPVFNGEKYIEGTVVSVLNYAEGFDFEYLVIDDGSTDKTAEILQKFSGSIRYIYQANSGQAHAINEGLIRAQGEYSIVVNADDPLIDGQLFYQAKLLLESNNNLVGVYPDWKMIDADGNEVEVIKVKEFSLAEMVGNFNCLIGPGGVFRTAPAREISGWNSNYRYVPDYDFWLRLLPFGDFARIPLVLATWRTHGDSISIGSRGLEMSEERIRVIREYLERNPNTEVELQKTAKSNSYYRAAVLGYFDPRIRTRKLLWRSLRSSPKEFFNKDLRATVFLLATPLSSRLLRLPAINKRRENLGESVRHSLKN